MSDKKMFKFQRFTVADDQCAMKIGTDAVLLGAWSNVKGHHRILDIGTGCGLIALMIAQRTEPERVPIDAIEIDQLAAAQAANNVAKSAWGDRIRVINESLQSFVDAGTGNRRTFDLCVCNPPYFEDGFPSQSNTKQIARHTTELSRTTLFRCVANLLSENGRFCLVLPFDQLENTLAIASEFNLHRIKQTSVRPLPDQPFKRVLFEFGFQQRPPKLDEMTVESVRHTFTEQYERLTRAFHLRFAE